MKVKTSHTGISVCARGAEGRSPSLFHTPSAPALGSSAPVLDTEPEFSGHNQSQV